jgi:hypothetical protein
LNLPINLSDAAVAETEGTPGLDGAGVVAVDVVVPAAPTPTEVIAGEVSFACGLMPVVASGDTAAEGPTSAAAVVGSGFAASELLLFLNEK